ncbi:unnamed protein product, partial [Effrenium voratum]
MTSDGFLINTINMTITPANKDVVITKSLGIPYPRELFAVLDELNLEGVLQEVAEYESKLGPKYVDERQAAAGAVRVLYSCWENMSTALFLLKSAAHRLCGSTGLEEFNIFLGDGKNGKSWWVDQLKAVFGSYGSVVTESDMLTRRFNSQQATPAHMELRGARLLAFPEMSTSVR